MPASKIVEITHAYIRDYPRDDCATNMSKEKLTTRKVLIFAEILFIVNFLLIFHGMGLGVPTYGPEVLRSIGYQTF